MKKSIYFLLCIMLLYACADNSVAQNTETTAKDSINMASEKGYEFGDDKYSSLAKKGLDALGSGDVDAFALGFADDAIFRWSGGDSLNGKQAILDYWKKRRTEAISTLSYANEIWLVIKVNTPMVKTQLPGNYALCWNMVTATYKTGKTMSQRMHMVYHFNDADKIDRVTQYLDRVPINNATAK